MFKITVISDNGTYTFRVAADVVRCTSGVLYFYNNGDSRSKLSVHKSSGHTVVVEPVESRK